MKKLLMGMTVAVLMTSSAFASSPKVSFDGESRLVQIKVKGPTAKKIYKHKDSILIAEYEKAGTLYEEIENGSAHCIRTTFKTPYIGAFLEMVREGTHGESSAYTCTLNLNL